MGFLVFSIISYALSHAIYVGYDFLNTSMSRLQVHIWYNSTFSKDNEDNSMTVLRVPQLVNRVLFFPKSPFLIL